MNETTYWCDKNQGLKFTGSVMLDSSTNYIFEEIPLKTVGLTTLTKGYSAVTPICILPLTSG